jgi:hypothetical protein
MKNDRYLLIVAVLVCVALILGVVSVVYFTPWTFLLQLSSGGLAMVASAFVVLAPLRRCMIKK